MFTPPEHKQDTPARKSNRTRKEKVAYTPPLTPADRERKQRCLQADEKRELDKIQTYVRVQKLREAQPVRTVKRTELKNRSVCRNCDKFRQKRTVKRRELQSGPAVCAAAGWTFLSHRQSCLVHRKSSPVHRQSSAKQNQSSAIQRPSCLFAPPVLSSDPTVLCNASPVLPTAPPVLCNATHVLSGAPQVLSSAPPVLCNAAPVLCKRVCFFGFPQNHGKLKFLTSTPQKQRQ